MQRVTINCTRITSQAVESLLDARQIRARSKVSQRGVDKLIVSCHSLYMSQRGILLPSLAIYGRVGKLKRSLINFIYCQRGDEYRVVQGSVHLCRFSLGVSLCLFVNLISIEGNESKEAVGVSE